MSLQSHSTEYFSDLSKRLVRLAQTHNAEIEARPPSALLWPPRC